MREPRANEKFFQVAIAAMLLAPLLIAFFGTGSLSEAYATHTNADVESARLAALAAAAGTSLFVGVLSTVLALIVGVPAGWALAGKRPGALLALAALPLALPASVTVSGWIQLLSPAAASSFQLPGGEQLNRALLFNPVGAAFVLATNLWPIVAFNAWAGFLRVRNNQNFDAARLSAPPWKSFWRIAVPQCRGEILSGALLVFLLAANDFTVCSLLLVKTLTVEIHDLVALGKTASAAWAALPLVAMVACAALIMTRRAQHDAPVASAPLNSRGGAAMGVLVFGSAIGFAVPMLACLRGALATGKMPAAVFGAGLDALAVSLRLAIATALLAVVVAVARLLIWPESRARPLNAAALFLLSVPGPFIAAAMLTLQIKMGSPAPLAFFALGYLVRFLYLPMRLIEEGLAGLNRELFDCAALLGHTRFSAAVSVALPQLFGHLAVIAALVFIFCLGEVPMAAVLAPPGGAPATIWLFQQQHMGYDEAVFALSLLLGAVACGALICGAIGAKIARRFL